MADLTIPTAAWQVFDSAGYVWRIESDERDARNEAEKMTAASVPGQQFTVEPLYDANVVDALIARIRDLGGYARHLRSCSYDYAATPCDCGLAELLIADAEEDR